MNRLIKLSELHYIIVDDSEYPKKDSFCYSKERGIEKCLSENFGYKNPAFKYNIFNITHSTQPLEDIVTENSFKNYEHISLSEIEEVINGYNVEKLVMEKYPIQEDIELDKWSQNYKSRNGFREGFKAHQELVKDKLFTIKDVLSFLDLHTDDAPISYLKSEFIKYSQPKTEWNISISENNK